MPEIDLPRDLTREEAQGRAAHLVVTSYQVALDVSRDEETFPSRSLIRFTSSRPGSATFVDLIAPRVLRVVLNGRELDPGQVFDGRRIGLTGLAAENELLVEADCLYMHTGEGIHRFVDPVDGARYLYSDYEPADARRVFACFDQPDLKAPFALAVTAPAGWEVVSNAPTPEPVEIAAGVSEWRFEPTPPLATYVTALVAGPFHAVRDVTTSVDGRTIPLGVFCRASLAGHLDADEVIDLARRGLAYFEPLFGMPYPFAKYDQLFVPEFNSGAMENAGAVTITEAWVFRSRVPESTVEYRAGALLHELAHMWFGDMVTMRWWDDLWLNESFATYAEIRAQAERTRWANAWTRFAGLRNARAYRADQLPTSHPVVADVPDVEAATLTFDGIAYEKGASVLRQLAAWVGQDAFDDGVRRYFRRHAWGNASLADLLADLEAASGRDLRGWSKAWLESAGITTLRAEPGVGDEGRMASLVVRQEAPSARPVLRPHRLSIGLYDLVDGSMRRTDGVESDVDGASTEVALAGRHRPDVILIDDDDTAYAKIRLDDRSLAAAFANLRAFEDPTARGLLWSIAWDMTRDAEMRARDYIALVLRDIEVERDSSVIGGLLDGVAASLRLYVAPENQDAAREVAAGSLLSLAESAVCGSDAQLQLIRAFARHASTAGQLDRVAALLDGSRGLDGLAVDADLRWELLTALAAAGRAAGDEIDAELRRDATAAGQRAAAGARAARSTPEAKREAWASVVGSDRLSNALQGSVIAGFGRVNRRLLLEPFVDPYFEAVEEIWATRTEHTARRIVIGLYPTQLASADLVARTDRLLERLADRHPGLRRLMLENRDGAERTLRAQARDRTGR
ncbi:MAG TPA: aminopeptidase N [Candidatus Limnocylindrales bacterium]